MQGKDDRRDYGILHSEGVSRDLIELLHCIAGENVGKRCKGLSHKIELGR